MEKTYGSYRMPLIKRVPLEHKSTCPKFLMDGAARIALFFNIVTTNKTLYKICFLQTLYKWPGLFALDATGGEYNVGSQSVSK
jgi:hypothetical protein